MRFRRFVRARLHRQLFMWLGITILFTGMVVSAVVSALRPDASSMQSDVMRIQRFVGERFERVWENPSERHALAQDIAKAFEVDDLANGIEWVLADSERRESLSQRSRERALRLWAPDIVVPQYLEVYRRAIENWNLSRR